MSKKAAWLVPVLLLPGGAGCDHPAPDAPKLIRLIDHLDPARVQSPLLAVGRGDGVLDDAPGEEVWRGALDASQPGARVATPPGASLRVRREGDAAARCLGWRATEQAGETALREHRPEGAALVIQTTPRSDALALSRAEGDGPECDEAVRLVVERIPLDAERELALMKGRALAEGADPDLGVAKHGQLLPIPDVADARPPFDQNFDFRDALYAPTPTDLSFDLVLPIGAQLRCSLALGARSQPGDAATFSVTIAPEGEAEVEVYRQELSLDAAGSQWYWHDVHLDLSEYGGRRVSLGLRTRAPGARRAHAIWGNPIVDAPRAKGDPPDVILIAVDTLRADRVATAGLTPRLDAFARDGVRFDQVISASDWTRPAFASIFTGLSPARHGVIERLAPLRPERTTLAELFRDAGWVTHAILYKPYLYDDGHHQGFDTYFNVPQTAKFAEQNLRKALIWIQKNRERRFFLFVHFDDPHQPATQPYAFISDEDQKRMRELGLALPAFVGDHETEYRDPETGRTEVCAACAAEPERFRALARDLYDDEVRFVDDRIGALLDYLREIELYDDAVIAFVADHGESLWSHDDAYGHGNGNLYDTLVRVPMSIKPPAGSGLARGKVVTAQVRAFDLMPTLLDLAGVPTNLPLDARSLRPLMLPEAAAAAPRVAISQSEWGIAIRRADAKYMHWGPACREAWFDLAADPGEEQDLADTAPGALPGFRLAAADYYIPTLPGRFVAVTGGAPGEALRVAIRWSAPARLGRGGSFGLGAPVARGPEAFEFRGVATGGLSFLAQFRVAAEAVATLEVEAGGVPLRVPTAFAAYDPEALARAAAEPAPRVLLIEGGGSDTEERAPANLDAQRLEALRALGYLQ